MFSKAEDAALSKAMQEQYCAELGGALADLEYHLKEAIGQLIEVNFFVEKLTK